MKTTTMQGPFRPFHIPAEPPLREHHARVGMESVFRGEYAYARPCVEDVKTIVHVGANLGAFVIWACEVWWPGRIQHVDAYEPNASALQLAAQNCLPFCPVVFYPLAVTSQKGPVLFHEDENWGSSHTFGASSGVHVAALHPRDLPAADVLHCDAEGVGAEVFSAYQHWDGVKVAFYESHHAEERDVMRRCCEAAGLVMRRGDPRNPETDTRSWVRP